VLLRRQGSTKRGTGVVLGEVGPRDATLGGQRRASVPGLDLHRPALGTSMEVPRSGTDNRVGVGVGVRARVGSGVRRNQERRGKGSPAIVGLGLGK
jgi:hypothetical protein